MKLGETAHRYPEIACLACGEKLDAATGIGHDDGPTPGDVTICVRCGHLMAFADDMGMRQLTDAETVEMAGDPRVVAFNDVRGRALENREDSGHASPEKRR